MEENGYPDKLVVTGLGRLDGEYGCDLAAMLTLGDPEALTNREGHRIKVMASVTAGRIEEALREGDNDVLVALAAIVLARHGKRFDEDLLWDAPMGAGVDFDIGKREEAEEDDAGPPEMSGSPFGGETSSNETSADLENDPSPTGFPSSVTVVMGQDYDQETSAT